MLYRSSISILLVVVFVFPAVAADPQMSIADIREALTIQEEKYADLKVKWVHKYQKLYDGERFGMPLSSKATIHSVAQDGLFRLEEDEVTIDSQGQPHDTSMVSAFDGEKTRKLKQKRLANVIDGKKSERRLFVPHMLQLRRVFERVPLSVYLGGTEVLAKHPDGKLHGNGIFVESAYAGLENIEGLVCHKLVVKRGRITDEVKFQTSRMVFWLARDRNLLPIRFEGFLIHTSDELPVNMGEMGDSRPQPAV